MHRPTPKLEEGRDGDPVSVLDLSHSLRTWSPRVESFVFLSAATTEPGLSRFLTIRHSCLVACLNDTVNVQLDFVIGRLQGNSSQHDQVSACAEASARTPIPHKRMGSCRDGAMRAGGVTVGQYQTRCDVAAPYPYGPVADPCNRPRVPPFPTVTPLARTSPATSPGHTKRCC